MSLVIAVYVPSGIVLAADSRVSATKREEVQQDQEKVVRETQFVLSDHAYKVIDLDKLSVGIATFGDALLENQHIETHIRAFEEELLEDGESVESVARKLLEHFRARFPGVTLGFFVAGYELAEGRSVPYVFTVDTKRNSLERINIAEDQKIKYGVVRGGDTLIVNRLVAKDFLPPFAAMPLQDAVDYAVHLIRTTIDELRFEPRFPTVGGEIDVLAVLPRVLRWVRKKEIHWPAS